jgi:hypothetical protein
MLAILGLISLTAACVALAQAEDEYMRTAKVASAQTIDPALPSVPFQAWIQDLAGPGASIQWETNDCGEATGTKADVDRDLPVCVEVSATLASGGTAHVVLAVGTQSRGLVGTPECCYWITVESPDTTRDFRSLSELAAYVDSRGERYSALVARFQEAARKIARLEPGAFPGMPRAVADWMKSQGMTVPQSFCDTLAHSVIHGYFDEDKDVDWAVLCSRADSSAIVVFWGGSTQNVTVLSRSPDAEYLQGTGGKGIGYSRLVAVETPESIRDRYLVWEDTAPEWVSHDGIADVFCEKASDVLYWKDGNLEHLLGAD